MCKEMCPLHFKRREGGGGGANLCRETIYHFLKRVGGGDTRSHLMSNKMPEVKQFTLNAVHVLILAGPKLAEMDENQGLVFISINMN